MEKEKIELKLTIAEVRLIKDVLTLVMPIRRPYFTSSEMKQAIGMALRKWYVVEFKYVNPRYYDGGKPLFSGNDTKVKDGFTEITNIDSVVEYLISVGLISKERQEAKGLSFTTFILNL